jgi:NAD(P)-dependent dehydrogenase (short-subunit alcohol dehydrogenase family)
LTISVFIRMSGKKLAKSILVTGTSRGLGLQLVKELVDKVDHLFATCRNPDTAKALNEFASSHKNVTVVKLDVSNSSDITSCLEKVTKSLDGAGLSCLLNNAGISLDKHISQFADLTEEHFLESFKVNVVAPAKIIQAFLPLLKKAAGNPDPNYLISKAAIANMGSIYGTQAYLQRGVGAAKVYAYRVSKVGLINMTKNLAFEVENDGIMTLSLHPGWVKTDMGGGDMGEVTPHESASGLVNVLSSLKDEHLGRCVSWEGEVLAE